MTQFGPNGPLAMEFILLNRLIFHSLNPNPKNGGFIKRLARVKSLTNRTGYS